MLNLKKTSVFSEPPSEEEVAGMDEETDDIEIVSRPDGYYWVAPDGRQEIGPFESRELALSDMELAEGESPEPGESLQEAEDEIGISDWIDPDTGGPSESQSGPRLYSE